jgi:hypothetical protein
VLSNTTFPSKHGHPKFTPRPRRATTFSGRAPDIREIQDVGVRVDPETPRIPKPVCPDLGPDTRYGDERIVRGYCIRIAAARVNANDVAEKVIESLGERPRPVQYTRIAIAYGRVQGAVGAELQHAPVVILVRLLDRQYRPLG